MSNNDNDATTYEDEILRLREMLQVERRLARTDQLTKLDNRRSFEENLREIEAAGVPFGVLVFDAANLHFVNKELGYDAGDAVLRQIASVLRSESDTAFRVGGDEFAVIVQGMAPVAQPLVTSDPNHIKNFNALWMVFQRVVDKVPVRRIAPGISFFLAGGRSIYYPNSGRTVEDAYLYAHGMCASHKLSRKKLLGDFPEARLKSD
jgi:GGDEF domain-containing protein